MSAGSKNNLIQQFKAIPSKTEKFEFVCASIQSYREKSSHVSPSQADDFLCAVLPFMEANLDYVNSHDESIRVLIGIIEDHAASRYDKSIREYSFSYHDSYEKAIFIVLSMVETSSVLKGFMAAVNRLSLADVLVQSFSKVLVIDISYATQEIALDILCRMAMYYSMFPSSNEGIAFIQKLLNAMPAVIKEALIDPKIGPKGMLVSMRQTLNKINFSNANIKSYAITSFGIEVARSLPYKRKISGATWIDFSRETLSLYIPEKDVMIKFSYHLICKVHFASASNTMQIGLESMPENMESLIQKDEVTLKGKPTFFYAEFGDGKMEVMENVRQAFMERLKNAETLVITDSLKRRKKYSIISSRDQTPEGHKTSAMGLHLARSAPKSLIDATSDDGPQYIANSATNKSVVTATKATRKSSEMPHYDGTLEALSSPEAEPFDAEYKDVIEGTGGSKKLELDLIKNAISTNEDMRISGRRNQPLDIVLVDKTSSDADRQETNKKKGMNAKIAKPMSTMKSAKKSSRVKSEDSNNDTSSSGVPSSKKVAEKVPVIKPATLTENIRKSTNTEVLKNIAAPIEDVGLQARSSRRNLVAIKSLNKEKENVDPSAQSLTQTPPINSRRRSYKAKSSPPSAAISTKVEIPVKVPVTYGGKSKIKSNKELSQLVGSEHKTIKVVDREREINRTIAGEVVRKPRMRTASSILVDISEQSHRPGIPVSSSHKSKENTPVKENSEIYDERHSVSPQISEKESYGHYQASTDQFASPDHDQKPIVTSWRPHVEINRDGNSDIKQSLPDTILASRIILPAIPTNNHGERRNLQNTFRSNTNLPRHAEEEFQSDIMEVGSQSQSEVEEYARDNSRQNKHRVGKRGRDSGPVSSSDEEGPSSDEDGVIAMLLEELVLMQKSRAARKRTRLMMAAADAVTAQVNSYLLQWNDFNESSCNDLLGFMTEKLETLCTKADGVCEALAKHVQKFDDDFNKASNQSTALAKELETLHLEVGASMSLQKEEEANLKSALIARKKVVLETAKKNCHQIKKDRGAAGASASRQNTKQLMLALRDL